MNKLETNYCGSITNKLNYSFNKKSKTMKKETIFIAFSTQKGGVGKSAMTTVVASMLHYRMGYNVVVFDCDYPQWSIGKQRERDVKISLENERFKRMAYEQFSTLNKKAYPIFTCRAEEAVKLAEDFLRDSAIGVDFIFFDMPGTVNSPGILETLSRMNYIFTPIIADRLILESTLPFMNVLGDILKKSENTHVRGMHLFWNMVDRREKSELYVHYEKIIRELNLSLMTTYIPDTKRFRKELSSDDTNRFVFRSSIFPPDKRLSKATRLDDFIEEFMQNIKR